MAENTDPRLTRFRDEVLPTILRAFQPDRVIAFGSRVRGDALRSSDLDLIVVASAFEGVPWLDRQVLVHETTGAPFGMDVLCYTPSEFERKLEEIGIVRSAAEHGLELYSAA